MYNYTVIIHMWGKKKQMRPFKEAVLWVLWVQEVNFLNNNPVFEAKRLILKRLSINASPFK